MEEKNQSNLEIYGEVYHVWQIPEYTKQSRGRLWYIVAAVIFLTLIGYGVLTNNFLFALLMLLFAAIIFMHSTREPMYLQVGVSDKGIILNEKIFTYDQLQNFWIIDNPPLTKDLFIKFNRSIRPTLSVHLSEQDAEEMRITLGKFLIEDTEKKDEPLSDLLWKILKL